MKTITLKLTFALLVSALLFSCTTDEDGLYSENAIELEDISLSYTAMEFEILSLINEHRVSIGVPALKTVNLVSKEAIDHTDYMIDEGTVSHDNFSSRHQNLVNKVAATKVGENVAYGYSSAQAVVNAWIKSEGHRNNLENESFTAFGISIKQDTDGRNYFTHIFIKR